MWTQKLRTGSKYSYCLINYFMGFELRNILVPLDTIFQDALLWLHPISNFYPNPWFSRTPLTPRTQLQREISSDEMGRPFKTLIYHQQLFMPDATGHFQICPLQLCWFLLCYCGSPGAITMPFAIYLMRIEQHSHLQWGDMEMCYCWFVHDSILSSYLIPSMKVVWPRGGPCSTAQIQQKLVAYKIVISQPAMTLKAGTHWPKRWTSEMQTRSGTNLFSVFSSLGSCWKLLELRRRSDSTCKVCVVLVVRGLDAIGYSDWLCASESARFVGSAEVTMVCTPFCHFLFWCFGLLARD